MTDPAPPNRPVLPGPGAAPKPLWAASVKHVQRRLLVPLVAVLLLLVCGFSAALLSIQQYHLDHSGREKLDVAVYDLGESLSEQTQLLAALEGVLLQDANMRDALKAQDRGRLLADHETVYAHLREQYGITHLYFHRPDRVNLLRVHQPGKIGGLIDRFTTRQAERTGKMASGIELGSMGTFTLRVVQPVFDEDTLIGYLELGQEIENILAEICEEHGLELAVAIHKGALARERWEAGMKMLGRDADWDRFNHDVLIYSSLSYFPAEAEYEHLTHTDEGHGHDDAVHEAAINGTSWQLMIDPLFDASGTEVGDLFIFHDVSEATAQFNGVLWVSSGAGLVILIVLTAFLFVVLRRVDRGIHEREAHLHELLLELSNQQHTVDQHLIVGVTDIRGTITHVSDRFCEISGYSREELIGQNHRMVKSDEHSREFFRDMWKTISSGRVWTGEIKNFAKDGHHYWVDATIIPFKDAKGKVTKYVALRTDISEIKEQQRQLREVNVKMADALNREKDATFAAEGAMERFELLASTDKLTGLPNRMVFLDHLNQVLKRSRLDDQRFALLFFDFDRFKLVNDSLGHDAGDALLCDIAKIFRRDLRDTDMVARFGGDEFVVLLTNLSDWSDANTMAERLLDIFAEPHLLGDHLVVATASIGLVTNQRAYEHPGDMIRDADAAMYQAKESGKAQVVVFDRAMHANALKRLSLEADLRAAVSSGDQFRLMYQPIVELTTGELSGFEALIRWDHPERGVISPADFIPIAEDTGLIIQIGQWVLRTAAEQIAAWNRRLDEDQKLKVNVNVSKRQLLDTSFLEDVLSCRDEFGLHPGELGLEITESTIADDRSHVVPLLCQLREQGFPIVMDDFGTGVSSLSTLHGYPIDVLKIDQAFIRVLDRDRSLLAVVMSITSLAENLGIQTVAEGIESADVVGALQSINCTWGQGYYFAKPMSSLDAEVYVFDYKQQLDSDAA